jgi:DNA adenine methylase
MLAPIILDYFPKDVSTLYEPFAGSAAVSIAALFSDKVKRVHLNDINKPLINLWKMITDNPISISSAYKSMWQEQIGNERTYYDLVRDRFNANQQEADLLYLMARCVKASIRYNACGQFNQSPDNRRKGMNPTTMTYHIHSASRLLKGRAIFTAIDYLEILNQATVSDIVYMDPPYQGVCGQRDSRYSNSIAFDRFVSALQSLSDNNIPYIVSYDGRTGDKTYGMKLPESLRLNHIEVHAGRSSQATLLGRNHDTYESLYISPALISRLNAHDSRLSSVGQTPLFVY